MVIKPLIEFKAEGKTKENYQKIKGALEVEYLPLFFQYLGTFPEYLDYITNQLVGNLQNPKFSQFVDEISKEIEKSIKESLTKSEEIEEWLTLYRYSPQFYNFETSLKNIFITNSKLAFIFIALREAVKGWAIAAKQISEQRVKEKEVKEHISKKQEEEIIFEGVYKNSQGKNQIVPLIASSSIQQQTGIPLERQLLPEYLKLCRLDFLQSMKQEKYLFLRLELEKLFLQSLPLLPGLIYSPINVVLHHIGRYPNYPELLYLLSEHFPVLAIQKVIFSGFLL